MAMCEYYKSKGISDFKNSKKFWQFYRKSIKVKSDLTNTVYPSIIKFGDVMATYPDDIADLLNVFFTSIKSNSTPSILMKVVDKFSRTFKSFEPRTSYLSILNSRFIRSLRMMQNSFSLNCLPTVHLAIMASIQRFSNCYQKFLYQFLLIYSIAVLSITLYRMIGSFLP